MPYIPWANYGICKFWMLKRCYSGDRCQWKHPSAAERKRLWEEKTAEQDEEFARGVARPVNPRLERQQESEPVREEYAAKGDGEGGERWDGSFGGIPPPPPPPPPLTQPPPTLAEMRRGAAFDAMQLSNSFTGRGVGAPDYSSMSTMPDSDVSMLDAPEAQMNGHQHAINYRQQSDQVDGQSHAWSLPVMRGDVATVGADAFTVWRRETAVTSSEAKPDQRNLSVINVNHTHDFGPIKDDYWTRYSERRDAMSVEDRKPAAEAARKEVGKPAKPSASSSKTPASPSITTRQASSTANMGATKRLSNGEVKHVGPHPSTIRVSARYASQSTLEKKLLPQTTAGAQAGVEVQERLTAEAREDSIRLQGCRWLDDVRRQMQLPIRTFTTACTYYHNFRLAHPQTVAGMEYGNAWADACAASLLTACKVEDTLKKSKDILAAAHNLRAATTGGEQVGTDDAMFEAPSRAVIGLERLVLEAGSFDFRSKYPHDLMVKIAKTLEGPVDEKRAITGLAWSVLTDMHRTFVPLKQTSATMAVASLELASHLYAAGTANDSSAIRDSFADFNYERLSTTREEVMETILDALDLYTHHTLQTLLGSKYGLDDYLRIRLAFNKECSENSLPRFTLASPRDNDQEPNGNTLRVQNGHPTPVSPPQPDTRTQAQQQTNGQPPPEGSGTFRFMLNPQLAADEKAEVQKYFVEEWEEYEEEIEVPLPRAPSPDRGSDRSERRPPLTGPPRAPPPPGPPRGEYRGGSRYDDRRPPRYDERRYDDRPRYDDRRGGGRYEDRRYDDRRDRR